ncbi:hypothetical protein [Saccharococcus caldoxylosilyticus]|jgi:hypothetical protein|uniref:Uncharacterized protein n=2 Tax=Saccharococcus caldoxylosilyticus TaxID=81408 RepID=A0A023DDL7_9BACL|nr:hypothetical protein [Parageobacillus caldoxylosilyticus]KYD16909.1 hypothetical protein B4119_3607 [Parageobacillus caldoxylosilyticus]MBB3852540.1 hypothetical protein [Parageobacillus caldoxylosilyticus]GAJ39272.1 hypothetical protein GCA01S_015_00040 [Parageobacillus caldoxylosilyticus NBRC 107762]
MSFNIGGIQIPGVIANIVQDNKQAAEQALNQIINKHKDDPAHIIKEIQQPSPFSQFLDIKI